MSQLTMKRSRPLLALALLLAITSSSDAMQQWNNTGTGNWFATTNWTPSGVPNSTQTAMVNNGGTATTTFAGTVQAFAIDVGKNGGTGNVNFSTANVDVQQSLDIGDVEGTFATGAVSVNSSGTGTLRNATRMRFGLAGTGDINVGQTSATNGAIGMGTATLTISQVGTISMAGDLDLGQTSGSGRATGNGTASIQDVTTLLSVGGDLDVGQTSAAVGGINSGTGNLSASGIAELRVGMDMDVAQSTGDGASAGHAIATLSNVTLLTVGDTIDVGKIRALNTANNTANATMSISGSRVNVGFGVATPGSIEIARVLVSETARGQSVGTLTLNRSKVTVANDVIVGELALGGTTSTSSSNATLNLIDSKLDTRDLAVANRFDATLGLLRGHLDIRRSLAIVQSVFSLSPEATVTMHIDGKTRALGSGLTTDYAAIDADMAVLDGTLEILTEAGYGGPTARGSGDIFPLMAVPLGLTGAFDAIRYDGTLITSNFTYVGSTVSGLDGLFATARTTSTDLTLTNYLALPGDANGDRAVDLLDFNIWNSHRFSNGTNWSTGDFNKDGVTDLSDFHIWNLHKFTSVAAVPEPLGLGWIAMGVFLSVLSRRNAVTLNPSSP